MAKTKPKSGPAVRSDMPVSDGRAHAGARGEEAGVSGASRAESAPAAAAATTPTTTSATTETTAQRSVQSAAQPQRLQPLPTSAPTEIAKEVIRVPAHCVPRMIGKGGAQIKVTDTILSAYRNSEDENLPLYPGQDMITKSGARIHIDKITLANGAIDENFQNLVLEGAKGRVAVARVLVQEVLDSFEQALEEIM